MAKILGEIHRAVDTAVLGNATAITKGVGVVFDSEQQKYIVQTSQGGRIDGVAIDGAAEEGDTFPICTNGDVLALAATGETINDGDDVTIKEAGRFETSASADIIAGTALTGTGAAGGYFTMRLIPGSRHATA